jgi:hypothetical protein
MFAKKTDSESPLELATAELEHGREKMILSMSALEREIVRKVDWHEWVRRKPALFLMLAFGLGFFLGRRR